MEDIKTNFANLKDHVSEYAKTYAELAKAKATKGASNAVAGTVIGVALFLLSFFFLIFAFTSLAWWMASLFRSAALGFASVAGLFLLLMILIFALKKKVIVPLIRNKIISKVYEPKDQNI